MHDMGIFWLRVATALYAVGLIHAIIVVLRRGSNVFRVALAAFCGGVLLHVVATVELTASLGHLPLDNFYESCSFCELLIAILFLVVHWIQIREPQYLYVS